MVNLGIPLDLIIQFCDNCAAQYKSRSSFAELARTALKIIRVYFGEKHGKSHADTLFGCLKAWMYNIRNRHFVVKNAHDFFKFCRQYYQTPPLWTMIAASTIVSNLSSSDHAILDEARTDLDKAVEGMHDIYSVRNTSQPLELKVRHVPCLCPPCITENGEICHNHAQTDPW